MSRTAPTPLQPSPGAPAGMGAFAQVAFAVYVLYSQEGRRAALAHWGLAKCGTPAVGSLSVLLPPLHTPSLSPLPSYSLVLLSSHAPPF